jgi:succinoglycan biosynthesis transport protein ExoP
VAAEEARPRHLELPDYIRILSKRKWFILIVTAVATLVGGLYALSSEKVYEATSFVHVQQRPQGFFWVTGDDASILPDVPMETYARIARSTDVTSLAARRLSELPSESRIIATPSEIQGTLTVSVINPDVLRIDSVSPDERKARYFTNYVAQAFVQVNTEDRQQESRMAREFLERQVAEYGDELEDVIAEMAQVARASGFVDVETEITSTVSNLHSFENARRQAEADLSAAQARLQQLRSLRASQGDVIIDTVPDRNPEWVAIQERLIQARLQLETLQAQYTDGHPEVLDTRALVQELERQLATTPRLVEGPDVRPNPTTVNIEAEIKAAQLAVDEAQARVNAASGVLQTLQTDMQDLPEARQTWQGLMDRLEAARQAYLSLQRELRQARLAEAIKQGNARVFDTAEGAREIQASLGRSLLFAGALGLFVGLALAILLEALDDTIYSVSDLQRVTDLYLLGVVPLRADEAGPLVTVDAPKSPPAEAYRTLRSNIRFSLFDKPARTFLVTSAGSGEGKSVTAANLAVAYAQSGVSVILVDTDLRRPVMHRLFRLESDRGVTNVVVGDLSAEAALTPTEVPGLRVLTSGPLPPNPAELLESEQITRLMEDLVELADIVIFDSPPAVMLTDATILASKVDRTILVTESGQITERALTDVERLFRHARADVLGIVLNKLRVTGGDYYYYYYYYYYDYAQKPPNGHGATTDAPPAGQEQAPPESAPQDLTALNVQPPREEPDVGTMDITWPPTPDRGPRDYRPSEDQPPADQGEQPEEASPGADEGTAPEADAPNEPPAPAQEDAPVEPVEESEEPQAPESDKWSDYLGGLNGHSTETPTDEPEPGTEETETAEEPSSEASADAEQPEQPEGDGLGGLNYEEPTDEDRQ